MRESRSERVLEAAKAAEALVAGMAMDEGVALQRSREAAERMGTAAVGPLVRALSGAPRWQVRWAAAKALGSISDPSTAAALVAALEDANTDVGWVAGESLATLGDAALPPLMEAMIARPRSLGVRVGARHVLRARKLADHGDRTVALLAAIEDGLTDEAAAVAALAVLEAGQKAAGIAGGGPARKAGRRAAQGAGGLPARKAGRGAASKTMPKPAKRAPKAKPRAGS